MADRGLWAIRGAIVGAAIGAIILVVPLGDFDFVRRNLASPVDIPSWLLLKPIIVGLSATQGIFVGVAVWYFGASLWKGVGLGFLIGFLFGVIFFIGFLIWAGNSGVCGGPGDYQYEGCSLVFGAYFILGAAFLVAVGIATGLVVSWRYSRHPRFL